MSMVQLTIVQCLLAFFLYTGLTVALPALVLYPKVAHCRAVTRFFVYFSAGNFYIMNLVYLLELLHISYWWTLVPCTVIPAAVLYVRLHGVPFRAKVAEGNEQVNRLLRGSYGRKNWLRKGLLRAGRGVAASVRWCARLLRAHAADSLFVLLTAAAVVAFYGTNLIQTFGYCASDVSVHNYWINYLGKNQIFVAGVYPFGFHNIVYYIHVISGIDTYALLRVFWLVQTLWIHLVLLMFLKGVCRSRYLPYLGTIVYTLAAFYDASYIRYYSSLPQEFGMLFILPAVYFAFEFFRIKKEELKGVREHPVSRWYLIGFALNFAMSFSAHFYGTIILGVFCVGIAIGYIWRFLQPRYFTKVVVTCFAALAVALLPMVVAYMSGTLLEGSLRWAMGVMAPTQESETETEEPQEDPEFTESGIPIGAPIVEMDDGTLAYMDELEGGTVVYYTIDAGNLSEEEREQLLEEGYQGQVEISGIYGEEEPQEVHQPTFQERVDAARQRLQELFVDVDNTVGLYLFSEQAQILRWLIYLSLAAAPVIALLLLLCRAYDDAFSLIAAAVNLLLLIVLLVMPTLELPTIMQQSRVSIYLNYCVPVLWVMCADRLLYLVLGQWRARIMRHVMNAASLAVFVVCCVLLSELHLLKAEPQVEPFQSNEAVSCLTQIIDEEKDFSWTIVSAYDELRMGEDHGYHYELINFLKEMEYTGGISLITIPTETVYFFVEKRPIDYLNAYEGSGQLISEQGAARSLPATGGFADYMGESRWVVMSRLYEWTQAFSRMYPHEMSVYYENENFICYRLEQNPLHLYNLSIDYGYNNRR